MSKVAREFVAFISEPAIIEVAGGVVRIKERSGATNIERAMSVRTFQRQVDRGTRALERFSLGEEHVVIDD